MTSRLSLRPLPILAAATLLALAAAPPLAAADSRCAGAPPTPAPAVDTAGWTEATDRIAVAAEISLDGGAAVVASRSDLALAQKDPLNGHLVPLGATTVQPGGTLRSITLSPDGRHLYAVGSGGVALFEIGRHPPALANRPYNGQDFDGEGDMLRLSSNGTDGVLLGASGNPLLLSRNPFSGALAPTAFQLPGSQPGDVIDALFGCDGQTLHLFHSAPGPAATVEILARQPDGSWAPA